jgi:DNA-binding transcriptional ArsR family regulator
MNMEGTKHEKVVLVILSYIIGFTSCFIVFGITQTITATVYQPTFFPPRVTAPAETTPSEVATSDVSEVNVLTDETRATTTMHTSTYYESGKLYAVVEGKSTLLSLKVATSTAVDELFRTQGMHQDIPMYLDSPDGKYVYFCEQQSTADECTHFIFDIKSNLIQFLNYQGKKLVTANQTAKLTNWKDGRLVIDTYQSESTETPWKMLAQ